jgi:hypothetical protein
LRFFKQVFVVEYVYTNVSMLDQKIKCFAFQMLSGAWTAKSIAYAGSAIICRWRDFLIV